MPDDELPGDVLHRELTELLNRHSLENGSDTPDYILTDYLRACLDAFDEAVKARRAWYGGNDHA